MSVPMEQMEPIQAEQPEQQMLSEQDEQDIDIIVAKAMEMVEGGGGEEVIQKIISSAAPEKQLAMFFTQMIEAVMTDPDIVELGVNPAIIMAQGGVIDELATELGDIVDEDISPIVEAAKPIIMQNVQKRADQFAQEGAPMEDAAPQAQPVPQPRAVMAGV